MTVLVGYGPNAVGEAALTAAVEESRRRQERLLVVNMSRDDVLVEAAVRLVDGERGLLGYGIHRLHHAVLSTADTGPGMCDTAGRHRAIPGQRLFAQQCSGVDLHGRRKL